MLTLKKRRIFLGLSTLAFLALAPILIFYTLGYRLDENFRIGRTGGLYVSSPISGSEIFVKNKPQKKTNVIQSGLFLQNQPVGPYPIIIAKEGYWPWFKQLSVEKGLVAEARAVLISKNPQGEILLKGNFSGLWASPYNKIFLLEEKRATGIYATFYLPETKTFLTSITPETSRLLLFKNEISKIFWENGAILLKGEKNVIRASFDMSNQTVKAVIEPISDFSFDYKTDKLTSNKKQRLWYDEKADAIWVEWLGEKENIPYYLCEEKPCEETKYFISNFQFPVKNSDFMPSRRDVVIAAVQNSVFALEIDGRSGRMSFPIYKGKDPTFAVFPSEQKVYVLDEGTIFAVNLE